MLSDGANSKDIPGAIGKYERSISREVKNRRDRKANGRFKLKNYGYYGKDYILQFAIKKRTPGPCFTD